jgi:uncharacterized membrane protein
MSFDWRYRGFTVLELLTEAEVDEINEELEPKKQTLNQQIGAKTALAETLMKSTHELQKQVDEVKAFEGKDFEIKPDGHIEWLF